MPPATSPVLSLRHPLAALRAWLGGWWHMAATGAALLVLALSPRSYRGSTGTNVLTQIVLATLPSLPSFMLMVALVGTVVIRIVVITAVQYGLSPYALEVVVRVLVMELIPLSAALYVAIRYTVPGGTMLYRMRTRGGFEQLRARGLKPLAHAVLPRVLAGSFAVLLLSALSAVIVLVLAYLLVHGPTVAAFDSYTRTVGRVLGPVATLIFVSKTLFFAISVALVPVSMALLDLPRTPGQASVELQALMRMVGMLLMVEVASLVGNYY